MEPERIEKLAQRVAAIREEAEALQKETQDFPAIERNAFRISSCVRMMEAGLGMVPGPAGEVGPQKTQ